jgi:hypothetical protein
MDRFDGTAARQLLLVDEEKDTQLVWRQTPVKPRPALRMLQKDVYAELAKRRRRAQIAARHLLEKDT